VQSIPAFRDFIVEKGGCIPTGLENLGKIYWRTTKKQIIRKEIKHENK
jgi:hypothetical protein